jgi:antirestriction protein ArdC
MGRHNRSAPSADELAERRRRRAEHVQRAARALLDSDGWQNWVRARGSNGLARYSWHNLMLIVEQAPTATWVCGPRVWEDELGYKVRDDERRRPIWILAPRTRTSPETDAETGERVEERVRYFRAVKVYDHSQVDPIPGRDHASLRPPTQPLTGTSHQHLLAPLEAFAHQLEYTVEYRAIPGPGGGWCNPKDREIVIDAAQAPNAKVRTLTHELAHALGVSYKDYGREKAEVLVETVTYVVCAGAGLDVSGVSIPYVAGWGEDGALAEVQQLAETIDSLAARLEAAIGIKPTRAEAGHATAA